jgi:hypothetical protein
MSALRGAFISRWKQGTVHISASERLCTISVHDTEYSFFPPTPPPSHPHFAGSFYSEVRIRRPEFESQHGQDCSLVHNVRTKSRAHPASYPLGAGGSFPMGKVAGGVKLTPHFHSS